MIILKILLIILLSLLALTLFILPLNIHIDVIFRNELTIYARILFVKLRLLPSKSEKSKKSKKPKKTEKSQKAKKEKTKKQKPKKKRGGISDVLHQKGISGFLSILNEFVRLGGSTLAYVILHTEVKKLNIFVSYAGEDAAKTAIGYGKCCAVIYPAASLLMSRTDCRKSEIEVIPNFDNDAETEIYAELQCKARIFHIAATAVKFIFGIAVAAIKFIFANVKNKK